MIGRDRDHGTEVEQPAHTDESNEYGAGATYTVAPRSALLFKLKAAAPA